MERTYIELAGVTLSKVSKDMYVGASEDHEATFVLQCDAGLPKTLTVQVKVTDKGKDGTKLQDRDGAPWYKGWFKLARTSVQLFTREGDTWRLKMSRTK